MTRVREILSANIKAERRRQEITQEKLAELADISAQMIHDIEGGRTWVSDKTLQSLAQALHVKTLWQNIKTDVDKRLEHSTEPWTGRRFPT